MIILRKHYELLRNVMTTSFITKSARKYALLGSACLNLNDIF